MASKISKEAANYRPTEGPERCGACESFREPSQCVKVEGDVIREDVCDLYEPVRPVEERLFGG